MKERLVLALTALIGHLPLRFVRAFGALLARIAWRVQPREAKVTQRNIDLCYPQWPASKRRQVARASMIESGKLSLEIFVVWYRSVDWLMRQVVDVHGEELLQPSPAGKGLIVLGPHIGNWEVLGIHMSALTAEHGEVGILYQPPKQAFIEPLMRRSRARMGATQLTTDVRGVAGLLKILKKGGCVGILPDQVPDEGGGVFADFFAHPAYTMTLIHRLYEKTNCRIVMGVALRRAAGFEVFYHEPPVAIYSDDQATAVRALNQAVEKVAGMQVEQYQWEYKRFRKVPPGASRLYVF